MDPVARQAIHGLPVAGIPCPFALGMGRAMLVAVTAAAQAHGVSHQEQGLFPTMRRVTCRAIETGSVVLEAALTARGRPGRIVTLQAE